MHAPLDERVGRWLSQAQDDLEASTVLRERTPHLACFHAQQCGEKALKALLTRLTGDSVPTHELERLLEAINGVLPDVPEAIRTPARSLDKYYVPTRYPDALGFANAALAFTSADVDSASETARAVVEWCWSEIELARRRDPNPP